MVMIINRTPHPSVVKEVVCKRCGATLQYVPADVTVEVTSDYTGCKDSRRVISCPACRCSVTVQ